MAGLERVLSDESDSEFVGGPESDKRKDNVPSSYFVTEFNVSTKKSGDSHQGPKGSGRNFVDIPSTSDRKVSVNVSTRGPDKKTEIAVTSSFKTRKKVDSSTQSDRNIVGQEESPPKERKKWQRPPVVGQAANIELPPVTNHQTSSDSELDKKKTPKLHLSLGKTTSYFDRYGADKESSEFKSRDDVPTTPENVEQRVPSPASASSLTSRPLEWDSGADVGYNVFSSDPNDQRLSTIEKLALVQGSAIIFKRSDPEGTTSNHVPTPNAINLKISPPVAESTPKNPDQQSDSESGAPKKGRTRNEAPAPPLFPEVIIKTIQVASDGSISPDLPRRSKTDGNNRESELPKKISASLEDMGLKNKEERVETFPRSNSQNNIVEENSVKNHPQRCVDSAKSRSSSSVSTVVNKRSSERSQIHSRSKAYDRDSDDNQNESNPSLPQHEDILSRHTSPQGTDQFNTLESNPLTGEARVNSFEYLPGHVYENSVAKVDSDSSSHHSDGIWNAVGTHSTLRDDVERGANLMAEFIRSSKASEDSVLKKQLVRRVVEKLINSEYPDDESVKSTRSSRAPRGEDMRMEFRGQISGESSTEKSDINQPPIRANKCVGTGMSTSLSGYTETSGTDWNSAAESSRKSTSDYHPANFSSNKRSPRKLNKISQISGRGDAIDHLHLLKPDKRESTKSKVDKSKRKGSEEEMLKYLKKERRNQLDWIKSEINHLSNLKQLLEKHEVLKRNLDHLKRNQQTLEKPLKAYSDETHRRIKLKREQREVKSTPAYLNKDGKLDSNDSASSCQKESGWTSHHYETEDERRLRKENIEPKMSAYRRQPSISTSNPLPRSTSYTITFPNKSAVNMRRGRADDDILLSVGELKSAIDKIVERHRKPTPVPNIYHPTLKECLETERPDYIKKVEARRQILSEIVELREHRQTNKQEIIAAAHADIPGPPPPLAVKRVFSQKNLRKQTERKYQQLAEVRNKKAELKRKEEYRTNRLMANVFNKKLQRRTLQGQVNLSNSVCVTDPTK